MPSNTVQPGERNDAQGVKSALRVLDLLEMLSAAPSPVGVSEIGRRLGIPKSSTSLLLSTLEGRGYVVGDATRRFRLNPAYARERRSWVGGARAALLRAARPAMQQLARSTGESAFLAVPRDATSLEYIEKVVSVHEVRCDAELGQPRPLHSTSLGLVILAFQPEDATAAYLAGPLDAVTNRTTTSASRLRRDLAAIRRDGFAVTRDTNAVGASGVAAPVFMTDGSVAALNVSAPSSRFDAIVGDATDALVAAATSLTRELGSIGSADPSRSPQLARARTNGARADARRTEPS